jgi:hypothetical protein
VGDSLVRPAADANLRLDSSPRGRARCEVDNAEYGCPPCSAQVNVHRVEREVRSPTWRNRRATLNLLENFLPLCIFRARGASTGSGKRFPDQRQVVRADCVADCDVNSVARDVSNVPSLRNQLNWTSMFFDHFGAPQLLYCISIAKIMCCFLYLYKEYTAPIKRVAPRDFATSFACI